MERKDSDQFVSSFINVIFIDAFIFYNGCKSVFDIDLFENLCIHSCKHASIFTRAYTAVHFSISLTYVRAHVNACSIFAPVFS